MKVHGTTEPSGCWTHSIVGETVGEAAIVAVAVWLSVGDAVRDGVFDDDTDVLGVLEGVMLDDGVIEGMHCTSSSFRFWTVVAAIPLVS